MREWKISGSWSCEVKRSNILWWIIWTPSWAVNCLHQNSCTRSGKWNSKFKQEEHKTQGWGVQTRSTTSLIGWGAWSREGGVRKGKGCGCNGGAAAMLGLMDALLGRLAFSTPCGNTLPCWKENAAIGFSWTTWSCCRLGLWRWPPSHGWLGLTLFELMLCHYQCCTILFNVAKPSPVTILWLKHSIHVGGFHIDHMCNWRNNICFY